MVASVVALAVELAVVQVGASAVERAAQVVVLAALVGLAVAQAVALELVVAQVELVARAVVQVAPSVVERVAQVGPVE